MKIPDDFFELEFDEEVLKHKCPDNLVDVKNEDVNIDFLLPAFLHLQIHVHTT